MSNILKIKTQLLRALVLAGLVLPLGIQAQFTKDDLLSRARTHAKILSDSTMNGRGYQEDGHLMAAEYIAKTFKSLGLQPAPLLAESETPYLQPFRITLNLVQSPMSLSLNGVELRDGHDYIAKANSGRGTLEEAKVRDLGYGLPEDFDVSFKDQVVMFRTGLPEKITKDKTLKEAYSRFASDDVKIDFATKMQAAGVIILKEKLTAGLSSMPVEMPVLEVLSSSLPGKPKKKKRKKIKTADMHVFTKFQALTTQNVVGMIRGSVHPDSVVIVSAHYDHLGRQDDAIFYGGNDNASGTAMLLTMAEYFSQTENKPRYTMLFVGFGGEEAGLLGSRYYVEKQPLFPLANTAFILNLDLMANGDEGITAVAGLDFPDQFEQLKVLNEKMEAVPQIKGRSNAPNSDHYFFVKNGVKGFFIYTLGGPPHYHDVNDTYSEMRFSRFYEVETLLQGFLQALMQN